MVYVGFYLKLFEFFYENKVTIYLSFRNIISKIDARKELITYLIKH